MAIVVNIHRGAPYDVYIGRGGHGQDGYFGNPYAIGDRYEKIRKFKAYFEERIENDPEYRARVLALRGKKLGCFCAPLPCHGDVIVAWLETNDR